MPSLWPFGPGRQLTPLVRISGMTERYNVYREVRRVLELDQPDALSVLPALAGEIMASGDDVDLADLRDALGRCVLDRGANHDIAAAVLAMIRSYSISASAHYNH